MSQGRTTVRLHVDVTYDPTHTSPEALASALDIMVETGQATEGLLDDYGHPVIGEFEVTGPASLAAPALLDTLQRVDAVIHQKDKLQHEVLKRLTKDIRLVIEKATGKF
jgi:hypothetical protein